MLTRTEEGMHQSLSPSDDNVLGLHHAADLGLRKQRWEGSTGKITIPADWGLQGQGW